MSNKERVLEILKTWKNLTTDECLAAQIDAVYGWIPVSERLPEKYGEYLCATTARPRGWVITYAQVGWICSDDYPVTHWKPIEPPKEGE